MLYGEGQEGVSIFKIFIFRGRDILYINCRRLFDNKMKVMHAKGQKIIKETY